VNRLRFFRTSEGDLTMTLLENNNATVAFGDSLQLVPHQQASPGALEFLDRWYSREYIALAVPRNDPDFRTAVDYAIQGMSEDGTLDTLLRPVTPADETLFRPAIWPGNTTIPGLSG
jgi:ABC-type amino acid transport substrate-binding protein